MISLVFCVRCRYPMDPYDRFWEQWQYNSYPLINLNTSSQVEILPGNDYFNVPMAIFQEAMTLDPSYTSMWLTMEKNNVDSKSVRLLPIFHFAEINGSNPNRRFDIYNAGDLLHRGFSPSLLQANSLYDSGQFLYNGDAFYTLNKTRGSDLPPLINAFEIYSLIRMENFTAASEDGKIDHRCTYCTHMTNISCMWQDHYHHAVYSVDEQHLQLPALKQILMTKISLYTCVDP